MYSIGKGLSCKISRHDDYPRRQIAVFLDYLGTNELQVENTDNTDSLPHTHEKGIAGKAFISPWMLPPRLRNMFLSFIQIMQQKRWPVRRMAFQLDHQYIPEWLHKLISHNCDEKRANLQCSFKENGRACPSGGRECRGVRCATRADIEENPEESFCEYSIYPFIFCFVTIGTSFTTYHPEVGWDCVAPSVREREGSNREIHSNRTEIPTEKFLLSIMAIKHVIIFMR